MNIFISRIKANDDFTKLLPIIEGNDKGSISYNKQKVKFRYNEDNGIIVIKGQDIALAIALFFSCFTAEDYSAKSTDDESLKMVEQLKDIITTIKNEIKVNQSDDKDYLFIHWGGSDREKHSTRLRNAAKKMDGFPFEIIDFSSTDDIKSEKFCGKSVYEVLSPKDSFVVNWDDINEAIKILIDQSKICSRRIYELMEGIYINGFVNYEKGKELILDNDSIFIDAEWLINNSKEVLTSFQSEEIEAVKGKITELYNQTENFKKFIVLNEDERSTQINDLMGFRDKINELLNILPDSIYSRDL